MFETYDSIMVKPQEAVSVQMADSTSKTSGTNGEIREYWVTRVVRQMKGCSPSRIDSVIQANLPPVKIKWSQCPDTLEIPGLKGRIPYEADNLPKCYELGYFQGNAFLHPEIKVSPLGQYSEEHPYQIKNDNIIVGLLIGCLMMLAIIVSNSRAFLQNQHENFFAKPKRKENINDALNYIGGGSITLSYLLLGTLGGLVFFYHAEHHYNLFLCSIAKHWLLPIYMGCTLIFLVLQRHLSKFINWIFFDKTSRQEWNIFYRFHLICMGAVMLSTTSLSIFMNLPHDTALMLCFTGVLLLKTTLLYKAYTTFLFNFYCILHLLSYLCALEIIPLMGLWTILTNITDNLVLTF